jgi:aminoglycoside 3-N-acetyltransferase
MIAHYDAADLRRSLSKLPLNKGDVIFTHSNLGFFGRIEGVLGNAQICQIFFEEIMAVLGENGTLIVPTFTYSFPRKQIFDSLVCPSAMGLFAEWVCCHPNSIRSEDPCYSVAAIGGNAASLVDCVPENSFGENSFFDRFYRAGGKVLNLNFDAGSTFIHYVERELVVPYRFDKTFSGVSIRKGKIQSGSSTIWVRYMSDDALEFDSKPFNKLARESDLFHVEYLGRGQIGLISAEATYKIIKQMLPKRPWFLTKAESMGVLHPKIIPE